MLTPLKPPVYKVMFLIYFPLFFSITNNLYSQSELKNTIEIVDLKVLEKSLKEFYYLEKEGAREEFNYKVRGKAMAYMPSVGFTLGMPSVSWSTSKVYQIGNVKRLNNAKLRSIEVKYKSLYNDQLQALKIDYEKFHVLVSALKVKEQLLKLDKEVFDIYIEAYEKQELTPLEYLKHKKDFFGKKADIELYRKELIIEKLEIYKLAKYKNKFEELEPTKYSADNCIMLSPEFEEVKKGQ